MIATGIHHIDDEVFLISAQVLAKMVSDDDIERGSLYPPLSKIREASIQIAMRITQYAYDKGEMRNILRASISICELS